MNKEEVYVWLRENPVEARLIIYELVRDESFDLSEVVKLQELSLKGLINENRGDACEGAVLACLYRDEMYGKGKNYASKQEVDERARQFINKVGCFPEIGEK